MSRNSKFPRRDGSEKDCNFIAPPEAPIFKPSEEEWLNPLLYIAKIRPLAEKAGLCKIIPPSDWKPTFDMDVDSFQFLPRIQHLNELEAGSRIKLNFLDSIAKFWDLQGSKLRIPIVEKQLLDLYTLHRIVHEEGGQDQVTKDRKWSRVGDRMGYPRGKSSGATLKGHYERILFPYDFFKSGKKPGKDGGSPGPSMVDMVDDTEKVVTDYKPHGILSRQAIAPPAQKYSRRSKRFALAKPAVVADEKPLEKPTVEEPQPASSASDDPMAKYVCMYCMRGDAERLMLLCDGCDDSYHTFCLQPPLSDVPKGDWRCPKCVAKDLNKPLEAFGFEQAKRKYTLRQFGQMADAFKANYFSKPVSLVASSLVEREFWRVVSAIEEDVTVEYGADLHTMIHGSGFPIKSDTYTIPEAEKYAQSPWNLNNLPVANGSVFTHIHADISGMKIPWVYIGMMFAAFCWHNEDHWSYSINYLHWGECKTWYGVPGAEAERFEAAMQSAAPELFEVQPDLLHELVTLMNPNILMKQGISVCRTDQRAGEFVVTFPRAYHAGFNQGYNFAEAVNFALVDWLSLGRQCIAHYSKLNRPCVFSHNELVCNMALAADNLDVTMAAAAYKDMAKMVAEEDGLRKKLDKWGKLETKSESFELMNDDERQCDVCKTTCFLSAVTCQCSKKLVCLRHMDKLCQCPPNLHTFRYRYTTMQLQFMLFRLKSKTTAYDDWIKAVDNALKPGDNKIDLDDMRELSAEARQKNLPKTSLLLQLEIALERAFRCQDLARKIMRNKVHTRMNPISSSRYSLTVDGLQEFYDECLLLPVTMSEILTLKTLLDRVISFQATATHLLDQDRPSSVDLDACIESASTFNVILPDLVTLGHALVQARWMESVAVLVADQEALTLDVMRKQLAAGSKLPPSCQVEKVLVELQQMVNRVEQFEERAKSALQAKNRQPIEVIRDICEEGNAIPACLPTLAAIQDAVEKGEDWISKYNNLRTDYSSKMDQQFPYLQYVEHMVQIGQHIPLLLEGLPGLESSLQLAKVWKDRAARTFLRKNSRYTLLDALSPRTSVGVENFKAKKVPLRSESPTYRPLTLFNIALVEDGDSALLVKAFKDAEEREITSMVALRRENIAKRCDDSPDVRYCICRRPKLGNMTQCGLCLDWFHMLCVPVPKLSARRTARREEAGVTEALALDGQANRTRLKFLCPCCMRSRRPRLETILALLLSLQKLGVRIPEGEALQCLTERAMNWQDRARTMLSSDDYALAMSKLECLSKQLSESVAREKTEKIITNELMKAACNPVLLGRVQALRGEDEDCPMSPLRLELPRFMGAGRDEVELVNSMEALQNMEVPVDQGALSSSEHAYSAASKPLPLLLGKKHARKSPLVPRQLVPPAPALFVSPQAREALEQLMIEGDLLEISIEEVNLVYKLYLATKLPNSMPDEPMQEVISAIDPATNLHIQDMDLRKAARKRLLEERPPVLKLKKARRAMDRAQMLERSRAKRALKKHNRKPQLAIGPKQSRPLKLQKHCKPQNMPSSSSDKGHVRSVESDSSSDESEPEEPCAAKVCSHPTGAVDWVQCDGGCQLWFHMTCIGLNKCDVKEEEDYICSVCKEKNGLEMDPEPDTTTTNDETLGLDALLSLANSIPLLDPGNPTDLSSMPEKMDDKVEKRLFLKRTIRIPIRFQPTPPDIVLTPCTTVQLSKPKKSGRKEDASKRKKKPQPRMSVLAQNNMKKVIAHDHGLYALARPPTRTKFEAAIGGRRRVGRPREKWIGIWCDQGRRGGTTGDSGSRGSMGRPRMVERK